MSLKLTQGSEDVSEFSTHHCSIALFVEHSQALNEVFKGAAVFGLADVLMQGQELFKIQHLYTHFCQQKKRAESVWHDRAEQFWDICSF